MKSHPNMPYQKHMLVWIIGGTLLAFAIFNMLNYHFASQAYYARLVRDSQIHTQNVAFSVSTFYEKAYHLVGEMARAREINSMDPRQQQEFLLDRFSQYGFFDNLAIYRVPDGVQTARLRGENIPRPNRWWFRYLMGDRRPFISSAFFSFGFDSNSPTTITGIFFPVMDQMNMVGALAAFMRLDEVQSRVGRHYLNDDRFTYILDDKGVVIAHPEWEKTKLQYNFLTSQRAIVARDESGRALMEGADYRLGYEGIAVSPELRQIVRRVLAGESGFAEFTDLDGKRKLCSFFPVKMSGYGASWAALTVQDKELAMAALQRTAERGGVLSFLAFAGLAGIILWQSQQMLHTSQQLQQMNAALEEEMVERIRMEQELTDTNQELTALNQEMMAVTDELQETNRRIRQEIAERLVAEDKLRLRERQYQASLRLMADNSATFDIQMQTMLDSALDLVDSEDGYIALVEVDRIVVRYAQGNRRVLLGQDLTEANGLIQLLMQSGTLQYIKDYQNYPARKLGAMYEKQSTAALFPLKQGSQVMGALSISWKDQIHELSNEELGMLQQFADMASLNLSGAKLREELRQIAYQDVLTGLPNRASLKEKLNQELRRLNSETVGGVLFYIDLDELKGINDNYGHSAGDRLLVTVGGLIIEIVGESGFVARLGGDEFVVVLGGDVSEGEIANIADQLIQGLCRDYSFGNDRARVSASIGIVMFPRDGDTEEELMKKADNAMYAAKASGRNCWKFFEADMLLEAQEKMMLTNSLRHALERQELAVVFQPQLDLRTQRVVGLEALLRWDSKEHGAVSPARFIPIAEQSQLILPIGMWVMKTACEFAGQLGRSGLEDVRIGVNLSPRQLGQANLVDSIRNLLADTGISPRLLELEITESALLASMEDSGQKLAQLANLGVRLALDDFGTGYSSLTHLRLFPVETLKIDKTFIDNIPEQEAILVRSMIRFAQELNMKVVAEGVERSQQWDFLIDCGCDIIQGYYVSQPLPPAEAFQFVRDCNGKGEATNPD